jgi:hypothetical protein
MHGETPAQKQNLHSMLKLLSLGLGLTLSLVWLPVASAATTN